MPPGPKPMPARKAVKLWLQSLGKGVASREMNRAPRLAAQVTSLQVTATGQYWPESFYPFTVVPRSCGSVVH